MPVVITVSVRIMHLLELFEQCEDRGNLNEFGKHRGVLLSVEVT